MIVSERISPNLSETPIREIVAHVIDNGAHCDTSREDELQFIIDGLFV
jgi:hypothetical protein